MEGQPERPSVSADGHNCLAESREHVAGPARGRDPLLSERSDADHELAGFARRSGGGPPAVRLLNDRVIPAEVLDRADVHRAHPQELEAIAVTLELLPYRYVVDRLAVGVAHRFTVVQRPHALRLSVADRENGNGGGKRHPRHQCQRAEKG